jgi:hypothetical protein
VGKQFKKGTDIMTKNRKDLNTSPTEDTNWARCQICNVIWDTGSVLYGWFISWDFSHCPPPTELTEQLCPDHVRSMVVDGKRKGIRRTLNQDQLNKMDDGGLCCPVCKSKDLQCKTELPGRKKRFYETVWICPHCETLMLVGVRVRHGAKMHICCSYREDLDNKEVTEAWRLFQELSKGQGGTPELLCS